MNLAEDGHTCSIYETRPLICSIDKMSDMFGHDEEKRKEFYIANARACNMLIEKERLPEKFKVVIE